MQGKKKICAIFTTVILFLSGFIYVTRFDVREGLCAEAGTDIEYILNENNLHDYINVSRVFDKYLTIDSKVRKQGDIYECGGTFFTAEQIPKISGACLNEIKAEDNIIDFGKNKYFKYVSGDGQEHCLYTDNKGIGSIVSEIMRGEPYDPVLERYASFWNYMMTKDPVYVQLSYSDEEIRGYMENAGIKNGFFTVKMGDREATQFYSATKTTSPIQSKERYDARYKNLTSGGILLDEYEAGDIFKIGDKEYILSENHTLDIPYGEDIYNLEYPSNYKFGKKVE